MDLIACAEEFLKSELDDRIRYESLLCDITREALKQRPLEQFIDEVMKLLGKALDVSRVYLFEYDRVRDMVSNCAEWIAEGVESFQEQEQNMPASDFPYWREQLLAGKAVQIESPDNAPDEMTAEMMRMQASKSILTLPFFVFGRAYGFIGFDECRENRNWKQEDVDLLRAVCRVVAQTVERERWADEMVRVERMAAMGRIAGVVAHEINNPLQGMMLHLDLLSTSLQESDASQKNLRFIEEGIKRITEIVWRIINLHREKMEAERVDLNDIVQGVIVLLERQVEKSGCKLEADFADKLHAVRGVKQLYHQAVLNVVLNAMESVQAGGRITVSTRDDGDAIIVAVADNGVGIAEEDLPHIFEPFFASKDQARPGLGLYIAHAVVTAQRGHIYVESKKGEGTTVTLHFPEVTKDD